MKESREKYKKIVEKHTTFNSITPVPPKLETYYVFDNLAERERSELNIELHPELLKLPHKIVKRPTETPENLLYAGKEKEAKERVEHRIEYLKKHKKIAKMNASYEGGPMWDDFDERELQHYVRLRAGIRGGKRTDWKGVAEELRGLLFEKEK